MGIIDDFERQLIKNGMTDEDLAEYAKLLKRVHGDFQKIQHCYTTAIEFPVKYAEQAVKLIQYGLDNFKGDWYTTYTSYLFIGHIYEKTNEYQRAYDSYLLAKEALGTDHPSYVAVLSIDLMWMKLHLDSFEYSAELEEYLSCCEKMDSFSKELAKNEFKMTVGKMVVLLYHGHLEEARQLYAKIQEMCKPDFRGKLFDILSKHGYRESLHIEPKTRRFLQMLKRK